MAQTEHEEHLDPFGLLQLLSVAVEVAAAAAVEVFE